MRNVEARSISSDADGRHYEILSDGRQLLLVRICPEDDDHDPWLCTLELPNGELSLEGRGDDPLVAFADARLWWEEVESRHPMPWERIHEALDGVGAFHDPDDRWSQVVDG